MIEVRPRLDDDETLEAAWKLYHKSFAELDAYAVQRHLMTRAEFDAVMLDDRIDKYLSRDDLGCLNGMSVYTNDLDAWPLVSPRYYERRWPERYAQRRIWYVGFVAVADGTREGALTFMGIVRAMQRVAEAQYGVVCLDVCDYNERVRHLGRSFSRLVRRNTPTAQVSIADRQTFYATEFPEPLRTLPGGGDLLGAS